MQNKLENALMEIYRRLYDFIGQNFDELMLKYYEDNTFEFWSIYTISQNDCDEIIKNVCIEKRIAKYYRPMIRNTVYLGLSPKFKDDDTDSDEGFDLQEDSI